MGYKAVYLSAHSNGLSRTPSKPFWQISWILETQRVRHNASERRAIAVSKWRCILPAHNPVGKHSGSGLQRRRFGAFIGISLRCTHLSGRIIQLLAIVCLIVQLIRPEQRVLVKRKKQADGTLILPHSPVLAPVMIAAFAAVSIACEVVLNVFLKSGTSRASIQRVSLSVL